MPDHPTFDIDDPRHDPPRYEEIEFYRDQGWRIDPCPECGFMVTTMPGGAHYCPKHSIASENRDTFRDQSDDIDTGGVDAEGLRQPDSDVGLRAREGSGPSREA